MREMYDGGSYYDQPQPKVAGKKRVFYAVIAAMLSKVLVSK